MSTDYNEYLEYRGMGRYGFIVVYLVSCFVCHILCVCSLASLLGMDRNSQRMHKHIYPCIKMYVYN